MNEPFKEFEQFLVEKETIFNGIRLLYRFNNGEGASVIRHFYSYGGSIGLWEVMEGVFEEDSFYHFNEAIGFLEENEVIAILERLKQKEM